MANLKEIFEKAEDGVLTYEQFETLAKEAGAKFADLSDGKYVSKSKYDADLKAKDTQLESITGQVDNLNQTVATRDEDLRNLQKQLEEAGQDASKLSELNTQFNALQQQYENDVKAYQDKMQKQAYEFAVKEFAGTKQFSSNAAKREFISTMTARNLQMEDGKILGRDDFFEKYAEENPDALKVELPPQPIVDTEPEPEPIVPDIPTFVGATPGPDYEEDAEFDFGFQGIRPH